MRQKSEIIFHFIALNGSNLNRSLPGFCWVPLENINANDGRRKAMLKQEKLQSYVLRFQNSIFPFHVASFARWLTIPLGIYLLG